VRVGDGIGGGGAVGYEHLIGLAKRCGFDGRQLDGRRVAGGFRRIDGGRCASRFRRICGRCIYGWRIDGRVGKPVLG